MRYSVVGLTCVRPNARIAAGHEEDDEGVCQQWASSTYVMWTGKAGHMGSKHTIPPWVK